VRTGRAAALTVFFQFLKLRHKVELHNLLTPATLVRKSVVGQVEPLAESRTRRSRASV
jgi:hypothetical protein